MELIGEVNSPSGKPYLKIYADDKMIYAALAEYNFQYKVSLDKRAIPKLLEILKDVK